MANRGKGPLLAAKRALLGMTDRTPLIPITFKGGAIPRALGKPIVAWLVQSVARLLSFLAWVLLVLVG